MKPTLLFIIIFILIVALYFSFLSLQKIFLLPLTGLTHLIDGVVSILLGIKIWHDLKTEKNSAATKKYFTYFFLFLGIFQLILALPHLSLYSNQSSFPTLMALAFIIGHIFLYIALAFTLLASLELYLSNKKIKYAAFSAITLLGAFITYTNIIKPNTPIFDTKTGITLLNANPVVGQLILIIVLLGWGVSAIIFIYNGIRLYRVNNNATARNLLIALGLIFLIIGGPLHDITKKSVHYLIADLLVLIGFMLMASGVFYWTEEDKLTNTEPNKLE
ncbi:MAG: hypothetical protein Q7R99_03485 [bacterium]|nr:hypothetical protein [bacterium]